MKRHKERFSNPVAEAMKLHRAMFNNPMVDARAIESIVRRNPMVDLARTTGPDASAPPACRRKTAGATSA